MLTCGERCGKGGQLWKEGCGKEAVERRRVDLLDQRHESLNRLALAREALHQVADEALLARAEGVRRLAVDFDDIVPAMMMRESLAESERVITVACAGWPSPLMKSYVKPSASLPIFAHATCMGI